VCTDNETPSAFNVERASVRPAAASRASKSEAIIYDISYEAALSVIAMKI
jgi:hypothetical protein